MFPDPPRSSSTWLPTKNMFPDPPESLRPIGAPSVWPPLSKPIANPYQGEFTNYLDDPIGVPRVVPNIVLHNDPLFDPLFHIAWAPKKKLPVEGITRINAVDAGSEGERVRVRVGVDSCVALSATPPNTFPQPIESTPQVGEEYMAANKGTITNVGQQTVKNVHE